MTLTSGSSACERCVGLVMSSCRVVVNSIMASGLNLKVRYTSEAAMPKTSRRERYILSCALLLLLHSLLLLRASKFH